MTRGVADRRTHDLRYVLKNKDTGDVFFVVVFTLVLREDIEKEEAEAGVSKGVDAKVEESTDQEPHKSVEGDSDKGFRPDDDEVD